MTSDEQKIEQSKKTFNFVLEFRLMKQKIDLWIEHHEKEAKERHERVDNQLAEILKILKGLPCEKQKGWLNSHGLQLKGLWAIWGIILGAVAYKLIHG